MSKRYKEGLHGGLKDAGKAEKKEFSNNEPPLTERPEVFVVRKFLDDMQAAIDGARIRLENLSMSSPVDPTNIINISFNGNELSPSTSEPFVIVEKPTFQKSRNLIDFIERLNQTSKGNIFVDAEEKAEFGSGAFSAPLLLPSGKQRTESYQKWLWSWSVIKKISKRSENEDLNTIAALDENDIERLEIFMQAKEDWPKLRKFLENLYDFADSPQDRRVFFLEEMQSALKKCTELSLAIDGVPFDVYAAIAVDFVIKTPDARYPGIGAVSGVGKDFILAWADRASEYAYGVAAVGSTAGSAEVPAPNDAHMPLGQMPKDSRDKKEKNKWVMPIVGALLISAVSLYGGMLIGQHSKGDTNAKEEKTSADSKPYHSNQPIIRSDKISTKMIKPEVVKVGEIQKSKIQSEAEQVVKPEKKEPKRKIEEKPKPVVAHAKSLEQPVEIVNEDTDVSKVSEGNKKISSDQKKKTKFIDLDDL